MNKLPEKFTIPEERIPKPFNHGVYNDCVAITLTKILEVINYIKTQQYRYLSKGYMYGRNNRPDKKQGGMDYTYTLNMLLCRGSVPLELCPIRDEMPVIREKLEKLTNISELDQVAQDYKIVSWEKIEGNIYKFENIKKYLYEKKMPLAGNKRGSIQHCVVIVGWDKDKIIYQDHDKDGKLRTISHNSINSAYYIDGGIDKMSSFKSYNICEFEKYIKSLKLSRRISRVQLHHTYSPSYGQFTGNNHSELQDCMRSYHIKTKGWSDIAQHFTIFPDGKILSGRSMEMIPAGINGANTGAVCIECLGNFDCGCDAMTKEQKTAIIAAVKILLDKFSLNAKDAIIYHSWWSAGGTALGDYIKGKSVKSCPGTNFFGGNSKSAFEKNLLPLIEKYTKEEKCVLLEVTEINDIVWELTNAKIVTDAKLWMKKCAEDKNVYWLCRKMANHLRGTLK